jgi:hypothetical protein
MACAQSSEICNAYDKLCELRNEDDWYKVKRREEKNISFQLWFWLSRQKRNLNTDTVWRGKIEAKPKTHASYLNIV